MENTLLEIKMAIVGACAAFSAVFGWQGWLVLVFFLCMTADYITGSCVAYKNGTWSSTLARNGLWHKAGMVFATIGAFVLDLVIYIVVENIPSFELPFDYTIIIAPIVLTWYILTELGSIVENAGSLGAPIPNFLRKAIAALSQKIEGEEE